MKSKLAFAAIFCFAALAFAYAQGTVTLTEFVSESGGFSVKMPGKPQEQIQQVDSADGPLEVHNFAVDVGNHGYVVQYNDYADPVTAQEIQKILDGVRDGGSKNVNGKVVVEKAVMLGSIEGQHIEIESEDTIYIHNSYVVGQRLYQVIFAMPKGDKKPAEAQTFMESFQIKPQSH